jgi:hypothetical protein
MRLNTLKQINNELSHTTDEVAMAVVRHKLLEGLKKVQLSLKIKAHLLISIFYKMDRQKLDTLVKATCTVNEDFNCTFWSMFEDVLNIIKLGRSILCSGISDQDKAILFFSNNENLRDLNSFQSFGPKVLNIAQQIKRQKMNFEDMVRTLASNFY